MTFVGAAYANAQRKRRSINGFVFTYCGGVIVYCSKTQSITTSSSTVVEFFAAGSCDKIALYSITSMINSVLTWVQMQ